MYVCCLMFFWPALNEIGRHGGAKMGGEGGSMRNVTPQANRDGEGHLQESLNFLLRGIKSQIFH